MPWKYCKNCNNEIQQHVLEDFEFGETPICRNCGTPIECDKDGIIIEAILEIKTLLLEIKNKL